VGGEKEKKIKRRAVLAAPSQQSYWLTPVSLACKKNVHNFILFSAAPYKPRKPLPKGHVPLSHLHSFSFSLMGNLLYIIAVILIIIWALGFFGILGTGLAGNNLIHILLVIAIIAILLRVISGRNPV
jgi:amino acid transporter